MSIATELSALNTNIKNAYDAIGTKGGTIPQNKNMVNLPTAIDSISGGGGNNNWTDVYSGVSTQLYDNDITSIRNYAFNAEPSNSNNTFITSMTFGELLSFGQYSFANQNALTSFVAKKLQTTAGYAFNACANLLSVDIRNSLDTSASMFRACPKLVNVDIGAKEQETIATTPFYGCTSLKNLVIRKTSSILKGRSGMFASGSPIIIGNGKIYVPKALVNSYKNASYWMNYETEIVAIEDNSVDGTVAGDINFT